jgi:hypothetical protein
MDDTATAAAEDELTEFEMIEVESIKAVPMGANGFGHLIMKGIPGTAAAAAGELADTSRPFPGNEGQPAHMPLTGKHMHEHQAHGGPDDNGDGLHQHWHEHDGDADHDHGHQADGDAGKSAEDLAVKAVTRGKIDEAPDIDLGQQIMVLLGKAIANEADEIAAGSYGETCDVGLLNDAASMINCWISRESAPAQQGAWDGVVMASAALAAEVAKAPREFTEAERKKHAAAGNALPDGSYPIPDKDALRRAAILARSGHGNVAAARKLIARRAKELGVTNPLDDDGKSDDAGKSAVAEGETSVQTDPDGTIAKAVEEAVAKATGASEDRVKQVEDRAAKAEQRVDQLEKLIKSTPVPGGPVLSANARPPGAVTAGSEDLAAKAALYRAKADAAVTPADREGYRQLARETDEKAAAKTA